MTIQDFSKLIGLTFTQAASPEEAMVYKNNTWYYSADSNGNITGLNLHSLELTDDQTSFLKDLPHLQALNLTENKLTRFDFTDSMKEMRLVDLSLNSGLQTVSFSATLPLLEKLDLSESGIKSLTVPKGLERLSSLDLRKNALTDIVFEWDCPALVSLDLSENRLTILSLPVGFGALKYLYLNNNQLEHLSVASNLPCLKTLHLRENKLKTLPEDFLTPYPGLETLYLQKNPLPDAIRGFFEENEYLNSLETIQMYFREMSKGKALDNETKVLLVGNGNVGKSCLVERLVYDRFNPEWNSTHGIVLERYDKTGFEYALNLWDFGGQDIYHATHRLFMQSDAVYLALWDWETENKEHTELEENGKTRAYKNYRLSYWLDYARSLGKRSPVIVVQTKSGRDGQRDRSDIREAYSKHIDLLEFRHLELSKDDWDENGCNELLISIRKAIKSIKPRTEIPENWAGVREWLRQLQQAGEKRLALDKYLDEARNLEDPMGVLENWLVKTGVVFYRKGLFQNQIILDQAWAIDAVYTLLRRDGNIYYEVLQARKGCFTGADLMQVWKDNGQEERELFISFMLSCDLCFETPTKDNRWRVPFEERSFVAPQFLPEDKPKTVEDTWLGRKGLFFRYRHDFLHDGVIQSFITRTQSLAEMRDIWRYGISLREEDRLALVEAQDRVITVQVTENGKELLDKVRNLVEQLQDSPGIESVSVDGKRYVSLEALKNHSRNNPEVICEDGSYELFEKYQPFLGKDENARFPQAPLSGVSKILFLAANPSDIARLQLGLEYRKLKNELLKGRSRNMFEFLHPQFDMTVSELIHAMNDRPDIVHFSGHGTEEGIYISDEQNNAQVMPLPALQRLFKPHQGHIRLIVLNSCYSAEQAKEISRFGMYVVGNNFKIADPASISFSEGLYNGLGEGKSIEEAYNDAMIAVLTNNPGAAGIIEIWKDGEKLDL